MLQPWHDLEPDAELPEAGPVADLLAGLDASVVTSATTSRSRSSDRRVRPGEEPPDRDGRLQPTGAAAVGGSVMVGPGRRAGCSHPVADRLGNPAGRQLAPAAGAVLRGAPCCSATAYVTHRTLHVRRELDGAAPRRQPAGAGPRLRRGGRPGRRRLRRVRRRAGSACAAELADERIAPLARSRASPVWRSSSERCSSNVRVASVPTTRRHNLGVMSSPTARRRQRSTRLTVAASLLTIAAVLVTAAFLGDAAWFQALAAVSSVVLGAAATRITHSELLQTPPRRRARPGRAGRRPTAPSPTSAPPSTPPSPPRCSARVDQPGARPHRARGRAVGRPEAGGRGDAEVQRRGPSRRAGRAGGPRDHRRGSTRPRSVPPRRCCGSPSSSRSSTCCGPRWPPGRPSPHRLRA